MAHPLSHQVGIGCPELKHLRHPWPIEPLPRPSPTDPTLTVYLREKLKSAITNSHFRQTILIATNKLPTRLGVEGWSSQTREPATPAIKPQYGNSLLVAELYIAIFVGDVRQEVPRPVAQNPLPT